MRRAKQTITLAIADTLKEIAGLAQAMQNAADEDAEKVLKEKIKVAQKALAWYVKSEAAERLKAMLTLRRATAPSPSCRPRWIATRCCSIPRPVLLT